MHTIFSVRMIVNRRCRRERMKLLRQNGCLTWCLHIYDVGVMSKILLIGGMVRCAEDVVAVRIDIRTVLEGKITRCAE